MERVHTALEPAARREPWSTIRNSERLRTLDFAAWNAYLLIQLLDVVTTGVALTFAGGVLVEANPLVAVAIAAIGLEALVVLAVAKVVVFVSVYRALPRPFCVLVPISAAVPTAVAVHLNLSLLRRVYVAGLLF